MIARCTNATHERTMIDSSPITHGGGYSLYMVNADRKDPNALLSDMREQREKMDTRQMQRRVQRGENEES